MDLDSENDEGDKTLQDSEEVEEVRLFENFVTKVWSIKKSRRFVQREK